MNKLNTIHTIHTIHTSSGKWVLAAALSVSLLAGCGSGGGDGSGDGSGGGSAQASDISKNVSDLIVFMKGLIATDENSDVVDINPLTLAVDNAGDTAPL